MPDAVRALLQRFIDLSQCRVVAGVVRSPTTSDLVARSLRSADPHRQRL